MLRVPEQLVGPLRNDCGGKKVPVLQMKGMAAGASMLSLGHCSSLAAWEMVEKSGAET
jgi:hypothetical protein